MLYPATYNITVLQNSSWNGSFRVVQNSQAITSMAVAAGVPTFACDCHGLQAGDAIVFTGSSRAPCGMRFNQIYYVISSGLATSEFKVSETSGGSAIVLSDVADGTYPLGMSIGEPLDLTGYTIDSDIRDTATSTQVATFTIETTDLGAGLFGMKLAPSLTEALPIGQYRYHLSLTSGGGERYYYLRGSVTVEQTYSREDP